MKYRPSALTGKKGGVKTNQIKEIRYVCIFIESQTGRNKSSASNGSQIIVHDGFLFMKGQGAKERERGGEGGEQMQMREKQVPGLSVRICSCRGCSLPAGFSPARILFSHNVFFFLINRLTEFRSANAAHASVSSSKCV